MYVKLVIYYVDTDEVSNIFNLNYRGENLLNLLESIIVGLKEKAYKLIFVNTSNESIENIDLSNPDFIYYNCVLIISDEQINIQDKTDFLSQIKEKDENLHKFFSNFLSYDVESFLVTHKNMYKLELAKIDNPIETHNAKGILGVENEYNNTYIFLYSRLGFNTLVVNNKNNNEEKKGYLYLRKDIVVFNEEYKFEDGKNEIEKGLLVNYELFNEKKKYLILIESININNEEKIHKLKTFLYEKNKDSNFYFRDTGNRVYYMNLPEVYKIPISAINLFNIKRDNIAFEYIKDLLGNNVIDIKTINEHEFYALVSDNSHTLEIYKSTIESRKLDKPIINVKVKLQEKEYFIKLKVLEMDTIFLAFTNRNIYLIDTKSSNTIRRITPIFHLENREIEINGEIKDAYLYNQNILFVLQERRLIISYLQELRPEIYRGHENNE